MCIHDARYVLCVLRRKLAVYVTAMAGIVVGGLFAGCDSSQPVTTPTTAGTEAPPARYSRLADPCPILTGNAGTRFKASGPGEPSDPSPAATLPGVVTVNCQWRPAAARPSVSVSVSIYPNGFPPTNVGKGNAQRFFDKLRADANADTVDQSVHVRVSDRDAQAGPAFVAVYPAADTVTQSTLADNAVVTVVVRSHQDFSENLAAESDELLRQVGPVLNSLTVEVVDDLR